MLDIKLIRENPEEIKKAIARKGSEPALIDDALDLDKRRRDLTVKIEDLQSKLNKLSKDVVSLHGQQKIDIINEASTVSEKIKQLKPELDKTNIEYRNIMMELPNPPAKEVIDGESDKDNTVNRKWGEPTKFDYKVQDNVEIGLNLDLIDTERAGKVAGSRFYYLKREMVVLEMALFHYALDTLMAEGFIPMIPPVMLNKASMEGAGYLPQGADEIYKTQDDLYLVGTAEQPLAAYHSNEVLAEKELPLRYAGISTCFRREAGSHGKDVRGILRGHQFNKIEMFSFTKPEDSAKEHDFLVSLEEKIMQGLELPYQVVNICAGDLGAPASKKFDLEVWMPGEEAYRETHSCSNCTDFQARRLNIRYKTKAGKTEFVHTLNGTAFSERPLIAILENYQEKDGSIRVPKVLQKYCGFDVIKR
ncbi:MAG: serine--tRNA ligase [Patescibacteria group bacterium]|jgi:seryl-tRNA synthetase